MLTLGKPQLVYLAVPVILIWATQQRRWRVWAGLIGTWLMTLCIATILSPNWLAGYLSATGGHDFFTKLSATISGVVKAYTGSDALRFIGVLPLLLIPWLLRLIARRDLLTGVNVALLISLPLAPYGWTFDQVVLLPAIVQLAAWLTTLDQPQRRALWLGADRDLCAGFRTEISRVGRLFVRLGADRAGRPVCTGVSCPIRSSE